MESNVVQCLVCTQTKLGNGKFNLTICSISIFITVLFISDRTEIPRNFVVLSNLSTVLEPKTRSRNA